MSETIVIPATRATISSRYPGIKVKAGMTIDDMRETIRNIAAVMPGDEWRKLMDEINGDEQCQSQ